MTEIGTGGQLASPDPGVDRRRLIRLGTLTAALTGASVMTTMGTAHATEGEPEVPPEDFIPVTEKASPGGVATLDDNAKLVAEQLPDLSGTYVSAGTGFPTIGGAPVQGSVRTRTGRSHSFVAGVIRNYNDGLGWRLIPDGYHPPIGITRVDSLTDPSLIRVEYDNLKVGGGNAGRTVTLLVQPDETLARAGFTCGASVSPNFANIQIQQNRALNDRFAWDVASGKYRLWKNDYDSRGPNRSPLTVKSATNNHLILGHPQAALDDRYDISVERIGGVGENYTPTISTSQAESILTQVTINFWTPTLAASVVHDWPQLADRAMAAQDVTVTGAGIGDIASATMSIAVPAGVQLFANVTAPNTVTVSIINHSGADVDLAPGNLNVLTRKLGGGDYRVTTPDAKCRGLVRRGMMRSHVNPAEVNETTHPSGNIWIIGVMQDQNLG